MANCTVYRFNCHDEADRRAVAYLQGIAASQKHNFSHIYPWEGKCMNYRVYVAISTPQSNTTNSSSTNSRRRSSVSKLNHAFIAQQQSPPIICGWLNCIIEGKKRGYITELTARAAKDLTYKGIGRALVMALEDDAVKMKLDFLYLHPLSNVEGFYQKVGYVKIQPVDHLMFKVFNKAPTAKWLAEQKPAELPSDDDFMNQMLEEVAGVNKVAYKKIVTLLKKDPDTKFVLLGIYEENEDIDDIVNWALEET